MKIQPGMLVVVVHTDEEHSRWLIGQVGTGARASRASAVRREVSSVSATATYVA